MSLTLEWCTKRWPSTAKCCRSGRVRWSEKLNGYFNPRRRAALHLVLPTVTFLTYKSFPSMWRSAPCSANGRTSNTNRSSSSWICNFAIWRSWALPSVDAMRTVVLSHTTDCKAPTSQQTVSWSDRPECLSKFDGKKSSRPFHFLLDHCEIWSEESVVINVDYSFGESSVSDVSSRNECCMFFFVGDAYAKHL